MLLTAAFGCALLQTARAADEKTAFTDDKSKISYGIGMNIAANLKRSGVDVDVDVLAGAIKDVLTGKQTKLTEEQAREALMNYQKQVMAKRAEEQAKRDEERKKVAETNRKKGEEFLAENKKKEGVKTHSVTMADGTTAEMQYKVITEGSGDSPKSNDTVSVNYKGTLINGTEFDSSAKHGGQPAKFGVTGVIRGWTEALQLMKPGAKWELFLPSTLAYGDMGSGPTIEPGSTLIFDVELVGVDAPKPPPPPAQPLTSDIIRVPSADELKKGAKIEVIKAEDVDKVIKAEQEKQKQEKPDGDKK
jgi:FKBP-type peptidyl-prolyl cis-trans isomerase FklB